MTFLPLKFRPGRFPPDAATAALVYGYEPCGYPFKALQSTGGIVVRPEWMMFLIPHFTGAHEMKSSAFMICPYMASFNRSCIFSPYMISAYVVKDAI